ncbi:hypothetical protein, partial [Neobacillus drentensis]|uniref:hypothetical protein n=1 Tax=Neobacillus drentensis TaxID=220684 RepID=UPI0030032E02
LECNGRMTQMLRSNRILPPEEKMNIYKMQQIVSENDKLILIGEFISNYIGVQKRGLKPLVHKS